ncbi:MAG: reverse transcriptase domain-containing protein, partial [Aeromonas sp.]
EKKQTLVTQPANPLNRIGHIKSTEHSINLSDNIPINTRYYRIPYSTERDVEIEIKKLLERGIIRPSQSQYKSPIVPIKKPNGDLRLCIDYRELNKKTIKDKYYMPNVEEILESLQGAKFFSILDAESGYFQIPMHKEDIHKTAFTCKFGNFEFLRMPFGLVNAPATFQRAMDELLAKERFQFVAVYIDDIIIYSKTEEDHKKHLEHVLEILKKSGLKLNDKKCQYFRRELKILGHKVNEDGISIDEERLEAIKKMEFPQTLKKMQSYLGLISYCRKFIHNLATLSEPFYQLIKQYNKKEISKFTVTEDLKIKFEAIKAQILNKQTLTLPKPNTELIITTDASDIAVGATIGQKDGYEESIISYFSKTLSEQQRRYSATEKELLAIVLTLKRFRHLLLGRKIILQTDHKALTYLFSMKNQNAKLMRWALMIQEFDLNIAYLPGRINQADILSRIGEDTTKTRFHTCSITTRKKPIPKIIDDKETQKAIIEQHHIATGHGGQKTMKYILMRKYQWRGQNKQINEYIKKCIICQKAGSRIKQKEYWPSSVSKENEQWQIDIIGPMPKSEDDNRYILTVVDV